MATAKIPLKDYTASNNGNRSIEEAIAELQRELDTRRRIMDRWIAEGKVSWMDAHDRLERHLSALKLLIRYSAELDHADTEDINAAFIAMPGLTPDSLDTAHREASA